MELQMLATGDYRATGDSDPIRFYNTPLLGRLYRGRVARCINLLPSGENVLEIGYGSGVSFLNLAEKFQHIVGLDLHNEGPAVARSFDGHDLTLDLRTGSILDLPYANESLDAALAISIHEHLQPEQQARAFAEVHRVLKPGGCYVVGVPGLNAMMTLAFWMLGVNIHEHHFSSESIVQSAMTNRFLVDHAQRTPRLFPKSATTYMFLRGWKR